MIFVSGARAAFASLILVAGIATAQEKPLPTPGIAQLADGVMRPSTALPGVTEALLPQAAPSAHAANFLLLRNGDLLCAWFAGSWEGSSGVGIALSRLKHGTRQWSKPQIIDSRSGESFQNPVLFEESNGTLHIFHSTQPAGGSEDDARTLEVISKDGGQTWTAPRVMFAQPGAYVRHPLVVLADGRWLLPITFIRSKTTTENAGKDFSAMELSSDHGKTWKDCPVPASDGKIQPTVVELAPGNLLALFRSRGSDFIYRSESTDGCTWTAPTATSLPNNNASVQMKHLRDGHLVLVFNNSKTVRKPVTIAVSRDGGKTWPFLRDLELGREGYGAAEGKPKTPGREEYSYPTVTQMRDGKIIVAFTYRRETIKVMSFDESWIRTGRTANQ